MRHHSTKASTLNVQILTWEKDSHGLYDYEATKHRKQYFQIQGPCKVFRDWPGAHSSIISNDQIKRGKLPDDNYSFFASINIKHNGNFDQFVLNPPEQPSQEIPKKDSQENGNMNTNAYIVVRYYKGNHKMTGFPIIPGNILKLGRVQFRVVEIGGLPKIRGGMKYDNLLGEFNGFYKADEQVQGTCKFCLCDQQTADNYLISPCKCKGSCEGVHIQCLKMWIDSKVKKEVNGVVVSYNFTKFECELCKEPFPRIVSRNGQDTEMISIEKPNKPYLMIEGINERKQSKEQRCLHVICPEDGAAVKIGRGHQCEIRLQDISVSRMHSEIKYSNGEFFLNDQSSKFGTLVKIDKQIQLNHRVKVQAGRSLYEFGLQ